MISQADLQVISTVFGKTIDEISSAASSDNEVSLGLRLNGKVYSQDTLDLLKDDVRAAGIEIGFKQIAKEAGLDITSNEKDAGIIVSKVKEAITTHLEDKYKNQTPNEKLDELTNISKEWENKYNKLNETYEETQLNITEWQDKYNKEVGDRINESYNNAILKSFPKEMNIDRDDALLIVRSNIQIEKSENGTVCKRGGKIITDAVGNPEKIDNIINSFVEEKKWIGSNGGMNGTDRPGSHNGTPKGMDSEEAYKYMTEKGVDSMSIEGSEMFIELTSR